MRSTRHTALRRMGWALAAAGVVGLAAPVRAQLPPGRAPDTPAPVSGLMVETIPAEPYPPTPRSGAPRAPTASRWDRSRDDDGEPRVSTGIMQRELPSRATGMPYVSSGRILMEETPRATSRPLLHLAPGVPQARLKQRIEQACGRSARQVEVVFDSDKSVRIRLRVRTPGEGDRLTHQILQLPELRHYQMRFEMLMMP